MLRHFRGGRMYVSTADSALSNKVFLRDGQLYIVLRGYGDDYALQLHAASPNIFFLKEFEQNSYTFSPGGSRIRLGNRNTLYMKKITIR